MTETHSHTAAAADGPAHPPSPRRAPGCLRHTRRQRDSVGDRGPPRPDYACEDCLTLLEDAARPDDYNHPIGDATLIDSLRKIAARRQHAKIDGVLVDMRSAEITVTIWDRLRTSTDSGFSPCRRTS